jgi:membrane protein implicated in regulation of membrane protease activity
MDAFLAYFICFGVGLCFTIGTAVFGHIFGGHGHDGHLDGSGGHAEVGADASDMPGVSVLSPTIIAAFITAFGGIGMLLHQIPATKPSYISAPLAVVGGMGIASAMLWLMRQLFRRTQSSSESKVASLVGQAATIITPIPENGVGEIAYVQAGTRYTAPAREENGVAVASGKLVTITRIVASQFFVKAT